MVVTKDFGELQSKKEISNTFRYWELKFTAMPRTHQEDKESKIVKGKASEQDTWRRSSDGTMP